MPYAEKFDVQYMMREESSKFGTYVNWKDDSVKIEKRMRSLIQNLVEDVDANFK